MTYPITSAGSAIPVSGQMSVPFRPRRAGLVTAVVVAVGLEPPTPTGGAGDGAGGNSHPAPPFTVGLRVDLIKPGSAQPAGTASGSLQYVPGTTPLNQVVVEADAAAADADLAADWQAVVTNVGTSPANYSATVRYQVIEGNLGKIDHIVVLMMENRSFDHMLGYLHLAGRTEVEGLSPDMSNNDQEDMPHDVFALADDPIRQVPPTYFANDPNHGWADVDDQLGVGAGPANGGFVRNFETKLHDDARAMGPTFTSIHDQATVDSHTWRAITFRPRNPGPVRLYSAPSTPPASSDVGLLAEFALSIPGAAQPITARAHFGQPAVALTYNATDADLANPGDWTCRLKNWTDSSNDFTTAISFVDQLHDTSRQEAPKAVMGYYDQRQVSTYNFLAGNFAVCDHWFASLPTDTFPNRLYALAGGSEGLTNTPRGADVQQSPPGYLRSTIFEILQQQHVDWNIFFADLPVALLYKRLAQDATLNKRMRPVTEFLNRARTADLPALSWIDPKFSDVEQALGERELASDDHPEGDISRGQHLAWQIYDALARSPAWTKTLFVIFYDEHGGFFDHVRPPGTPEPAADPATPAPDGPEDDNPALKRYGVRVPALAVSAWIGPATVDKTVYDHTSMLATILQRFRPDARQAMGTRTEHAQDLGGLLAATAPRPAPTASEPAQAPPMTRLTPTDPDAFGTVLRKSLLGF